MTRSSSSTPSAGSASLRASCAGGPLIGQPAASTALTNPTGVSFAPDGSIVVAANGNGRVVRVRSDGVLDNVAGNGINCNSIVGVVADDTPVQDVVRVVVDDRGVAFFATTAGVFNVDGDGRLQQQLRTDCNPARITMFNGTQRASALAVDPVGGRVLLGFFTAFANCTDATFAGATTQIVPLDDAGVRAPALFSTAKALRSVAVHPRDGAAFVVAAPADNSPLADHRLFEVDLDDGSSVDVTDHLGGAVPWAAAFDNDGVLYVLDRQNGRLIAWRPR